jgi:hypothetical protein
MVVYTLCQAIKRQKAILGCRISSFTVTIRSGAKDLPHFKKPFATTTYSAQNGPPVRFLTKAVTDSVIPLT